MDLSRVVHHAPAELEGEREAAVLVPVVERAGGHHLLFTKRAAHLAEHPDQMSFPGGGREPEDENLEDTALREAREEIGLDATEASVLGRLDDIYTVSEYAVRPFVATIPDRTYVPSEAEVAEVVVLPERDLRDLRIYRVERRHHPTAGVVDVHYFEVGEYTVWGATARILVQLLEVATDWRPPSAVNRALELDVDL